VLVELSVMEQRYQAMLAVVQDGWKVVEVARRLRGDPPERPQLDRPLRARGSLPHSLDDRGRLGSEQLAFFGQDANIKVRNEDQDTGARVAAAEPDVVSSFRTRRRALTTRRSFASAGTPRGLRAHAPLLSAAAPRVPAEERRGPAPKAGPLSRSRGAKLLGQLEDRRPELRTVIEVHEHSPARADRLLTEVGIVDVLVRGGVVADRPTGLERVN
jgi:hypothetical protein